ncbi:MAG: glycosyltransferase family 4 protein [Actinomycetota bacterium]|nr:glycosyltransferase family 4 protein [Actinomycetota bacterium]
MTRILLVAKGPPDRGGISAFVQRLLEGRLAELHDVRLLNLTRNETPAGGRLTARNVVRTLSDARRLRLEARAADAVHVHTALVPFVTLVRAGVLARAARPRRNRVLVHVHSGLVERWLHGRGRRLAAKVLLRPCDTVVACSHGSHAALAAVLGDRVVLVDNGVDLDRFEPGPAPAHAPPRILYAGLLSPRKGVVDLISASRLLAERGVAHELWIAGGTPDEGPEAERQVRAEHSPALRWLGPRPHESMPGLYRETDVLCLPSWWEAMPLSILEAMASGRPVVATDVGDLARAVLPGRTGLLVPPRDPAALAAALEELLRDPAAREAYGRAGRELVATAFSEEAMLDALVPLYRDPASK